MPGSAKITPSAPIPKFRSQSFAACSGVILGSEESLLSTYHSQNQIINKKTKTQNRESSTPNPNLFVPHQISKFAKFSHIFIQRYKITKMKSLPRPWYLTKWRNPVSLRSRKEAGEAFSTASTLIEDEAAETRRQAVLKETLPLTELSFRIGEEDRREVKEARERRAGDVRGSEMAAAMAMTLTLIVTEFPPQLICCFTSYLS